jgi:Lrp/AsnC family leucine-responsive transcriptional regulator
MQLDRLDLKILQIIQSRGRLANKELAELVNLSPSACHQRFQRLQQEGWIQGFRADVDVERLCAPVQAIATLALSNHSPETFHILETLVESMPEALEAFTVSGSFDFIIRFACPNMARYMSLTSSLIKDCPAIANVSTHVIMRENKRFKGFPISQLTTLQLKSEG